MPSDYEAKLEEQLSLADALAAAVEAWQIEMQVVSEGPCNPPCISCEMVANARAYQATRRGGTE